MKRTAHHSRNTRCTVPLLGLLLLSSCRQLPDSPEKEISFSQAPASEGLLAESSDAVISRATEAESAFLLVPRNDEALRWRLAMIDSAQQSIDLQVYIWTNDESGRLLMSRIVAAAERGVRVRILIDDWPKNWSDLGNAMLSRMPNIQVRRFNPGRVRKGLIGRAFQMSTQFRQLNRRMHNKQLIADGRWGLIGGRNIGNPYFGLSTKYNNRDLDLLVTGPVISELANDFDEYWNSDVAYPGEAMVEEVSAKQMDKGRDQFKEALAADQELLRQTTIPVEPIDWRLLFQRLATNMVFGTAQTLSDSPAVRSERGIRLNEQIANASPDVRRIARVITPYLIPTKKLLADIERNVQEEGRRVVILVPAMDSNNQTMVHSHYKKYRKKLLRAGADLYEFRGQPSDTLRTDSDTRPVESKFVSLHTKAFVLDEERVLLGSLNIDPRSININTEHMMIIDSPELAEKLSADFNRMIDPHNAWKVTIDDNGRLRWTSTEGVMTRQPARSTGQRFKDFFYRLLPLESQL